MPRYRYRCTSCDDERVVFHSFDETPSLSCESCLSEDALQKVIGNLYFKTKEAGVNKQAVGQLTKQYIEENKKILEEEKKKARNEKYEPS
jgi:putative FmdB family regulatory protein|tara:strand:- start:459 stop:728 length:270 start_codon:yes stop_codon:yes gene_type:complete